jgi:HD superfamily phosphodiesterase
MEQQTIQTAPNVWEICSNFVQMICSGRDPSHGHEHMQTVAQNAKFIAEKDFASCSNFPQLLQDVIVTAWLHDVADHKYDQTHQLEKLMDEFGFKHFVNYEHLKKVIKLISYSSENKAIQEGKPIDYSSILGPHYAIVRHIVSDADKLEAIGEIGIKRCEEYTRHMNPELDSDHIAEKIYIHSLEKLLRIKHEFIRTDTGKSLAIPLHEQMVDILLMI